MPDFSVFFHLEQPAPLAVLPAGRIMLRGWATGTEGVPLVDLRVRAADGSIHSAAYGFLRQDLAAHFRWRQPQLPGGFEAQVPLHAGSQTFAFEGCDISGTWRSLGSVTLVGAAAAQVAQSSDPRSDAEPSLTPHEFVRILERVLRARGPGAHDVHAALLDLPLDPVTRFAPRPFLGHLHHPARLEHSVFGRLPIEGWLLHESQEIKQVVATVDLQAWQSLDFDRPLPAGLTRESLGMPADAPGGGFAGFIDVPAQLPSPVSVRVYAQLADSSWHLGQIQRAALTTLEERKQPLLPLGRLALLRAALALRQAARRRGLRPPTARALLPLLRELHRDVRVRRSAAAPTPASLVPAVSVHAPLSRPRHFTLITHNLNYEGAPLFLLEYARHLVSEGMALRVISGREGPLRADYARLGAEPVVVDPAALHTRSDRRGWNDALGLLGASLELRATDLVVANTLSAYWAVHLAHRAGRPSLLYIHESTTPARFYHGHLAPALLPAIEESFRLATHVSFLTDATRHYYRPLLGASNHSINPGWIDLAAIDRYRAAHPRETLRRQLGLDAATPLVINLGTVCDRKGQHIFARAVDLAARRRPELIASSRIQMVGGRDTPFDRVIADLLRQLNRPSLTVVPETPAPLAYLAAADLFVCSSYEESFPRVVLEAMACEVPILSTAVHGIPEMVRDGREAILIPAGDTHAMASGLVDLLASPRRDLAAQARIRVAAEYDARLLLPRHLALACGLAASPA